VADRDGPTWIGLAAVSAPITLELGVPDGPGRPLHSCLVVAPNAAIAAARCLANGVEIEAGHLGALSQLPPAAPAYTAGVLLGGTHFLRPASAGRVLVWPAGGGPVVLAVSGAPPCRVGLLTFDGDGWRLDPARAATARGGGTGAGRAGGRVRSSVYLDQPDHDRIGTLAGEAGVVPAEMHRQVVKAGLAARDGSPWQPRLAGMWAAAVEAQQAVTASAGRWLESPSGQPAAAEVGRLVVAETRRDTIVTEYARLLGADPGAMLARLLAETAG